jgi:hypothetical protein
MEKWHTNAEQLFKKKKQKKNKINKESNCTIQFWIGTIITNSEEAHLH